jgi:dephospho-CoA kinase
MGAESQSSLSCSNEDRSRGGGLRVIGLTGGIASGKTTVARLLAAHGGAIVDADVAAREVVAPGEPALAEIAAAFGPTVIAPDGTLNRPALAAIVFRDATARATLNAITHPRVRQRMRAQLDALRHQAPPPPFAVLVVPLLLESGLRREDWGIDAIWLVAVPEDVQRARLMARDGLSAEEAEARIRTQMPLAEKLKLADQVIPNTGTPAEVEAALATLLRTERLG